MRLKKSLIAICVAALIYAVAASASTINVPADQPTIQAGIDAASNGDAVLVAPGTYFENINFDGKAITVQSSSGAATTIIDGGHNGSVITFDSAEQRGSVLSGFTIQSGTGFKFGGDTQGGGIEIDGASPRVSNNTISNNSACDGAGIAILDGGAPTIQQNTITNNTGCTGGYGGGGIFISGGGAFQITSNTISDNNVCCANGGGIYINGAIGYPAIKNNIIRNNTSGGSGGGIWAANEVNANIVQNLFTDNISESGGAIYWSVPGSTRGPFLINNTFSGNKVYENCTQCEGSTVYLTGYYAHSFLENNLLVGFAGQTVLYCDKTYTLNPPMTLTNDAYSVGGQGYGAACFPAMRTNGNISVDPLFVNPMQRKYQLSAGSPAIDAGTNSAPSLPATDLAGKPRIVDGNNDGNTVIDMGAYEFQ